MTPLVSTAYLPPISYLALLVQQKGAVVEVNENFEKQTYRNRSHIYGANGMQILTVPVLHSSSKTPLRELKISYQENWPVLHWRSIVSAYKGRPFFDVLAPDVKQVLDSRPTFLLDLNTQLLRVILDWLQEDLEVKESQKFTIPTGQADDFRAKIHPKKESILEAPKVYFQQFSVQHGFIKDLSVIDLIFTEGRASWDYLNQSQLKTGLI